MTGSDGREQRVLWVSIAVSAALGALGVVWGVVAGSQMILLDGAYGLIGIVTSVLLLRASALAAQRPSRTYPFGRQASTPLAIGIQGLVILATLGYAALEAAAALLDGGSQVSAGAGLAYAAIVTSACLATWVWLRRQAAGSELLRAESMGWRIAAFRGVGMLVGFSVLLVVSGSALDRLAPFVDPVMVLVTCVVFLPEPIRMVRSTFLELLERAPTDDVATPVRAALDRVAAGFELRDVVVRMSKLGPKLYLEVEALAAPEVTLGQVDELRRAIVQGLDHLPYAVWLNLDLYPDAATEGPADGRS